MRFGQARVAAMISILAGAVVIMLGGGTPSGGNLILGILVGGVVFALISMASRSARDASVTAARSQAPKRAKVSTPSATSASRPTGVSSQQLSSVPDGSDPRLYDRAVSAVARLYDAGAKGDTIAVQLAIADGAPVNGYTRDHEFAALWAPCWFNKPEVVRVLLDQGADPNGMVWPSGPPLPLAAFHAGAEVVRLLLDGGANPDQANKEGQTALHMASMQGDDVMARMLLEAGADPNKSDRSKWTPLKLAARYGFGELAALLIERGARA